MHEFLLYTNKTLSLHSDNNYRNPIPGIQLLHCLTQTTSPEGGINTLVDAFYVANQLKELHPDKFHILSTTPKPFTYYS